MKYEITVGGTTRLVTIEPEAAPGPFTHRLSWSETGADGVVREETHLVNVLRPSPEAFHLLIDGESWEAGCTPVGADGYLVDVVGTTMAVGVVDPRRKALRLGTGAAGGLVATQMPGRVVRVMVAVGDAVAKGQPLVVVEAMKMENELKSPLDGVVGELYVTAGQAVDSGAKLVRVDARAAS